MTAPRASVVLLLAAVAVGGAGCESTQSRSARLKAASADRPAEKRFSITEESRDVSVESAQVLQDDLGAAVVVELRSRSRRPQASVPVAIEVAAKGGAKLFANDAPGLESALIAAPLIEPGRRLLWVNDQVRLSGRASRAKAKVGKAKQPSPAKVPKIELVGTPKLAADPSGGFTATGKVRNASAIEQIRLVVFAIARRGGRIVGAGRSVVPRLKPGAKARFTAFLVGAPRGAKLTVTPLPTTFR